MEYYSAIKKNKILPFTTPWMILEGIMLNDAEAETPILWLPDVKNWLIGKDHDAGKDWRCEEKGTTEDEMVGWHHQLNGHEFEQAPGVGEGLGSLACCSPWGHSVRHDWVTELILRERSQTAKDKYCMVPLTCESKK